MNTVTLIGCEEGVRQTVSRHLTDLPPGTLLQSAEPDDLPDAGTGEALLIVCVDAAEQYLDSVFSGSGTDAGQHAPSPRAVLWVPEGHEPLPFDEWWEGFHLQLRENSDADRVLLGVLGRSPQVLDWMERVEDIAPAWFDDLTESPRALSPERLPFTPTLRQELASDPVCLEWVRERLAGRAEMRWSLLCPSPEEIADWLESAEADARLEANVTRCALARELVQRQSALCVSAGLITPEQAAAKRQAVGVRPPVGEAIRAALTGAWAEAQLQWDTTLQSSAAGLGALLASAFGVQHIQRAAARSTAPTAYAALETTELANLLASGEPITLAYEGHWLHFLLDEEGVRIRAGESAIKRFPDFTVLLSRDQEPLASFVAERGVAILTAEAIRRAHAGGADRLTITREGAHDSTAAGRRGQ